MQSKEIIFMKMRKIELIGKNCRVLITFPFPQRCRFCHKVAEIYGSFFSWPPKPTFFSSTKNYWFLIKIEINFYVLIKRKKDLHWRVSVFSRIPCPGHDEHPHLNQCYLLTLFFWLQFNLKYLWAKNVLFDLENHESNCC